MDMTLAESVVLKKTGSTGAINWRQVSLFVNDDESLFELREYYGYNNYRSLKLTKQFKFDSYAIAKMNLDNATASREIDGYTVYETMASTQAGFPFCKFTPQKYKIHNAQTALSLFQKIEDPVVIPIAEGERVYIKFGHESLSSVKAMLPDGQMMRLPESVTDSILLSVKLGKVESGVVEALIKGNQVTLIDVCAINGVPLTQCYYQRLKTAEKLFARSKVVSVMTPQKQLEPHLPCRVFVVKESQTTPLTGEPIVVPNFYEVDAVITDYIDIKKGRYKVALRDEEQMDVVVGEIQWTRSPLERSMELKVAFQSISEGRMTMAWVSPNQRTHPTMHGFNKAPVSQLNNIEACWKGVL